jgi:hypothetical protein
MGYVFRILLAENGSGIMLLMGEKSRDFSRLLNIIHYSKAM